MVKHIRYSILKVVSDAKPILNNKQQEKKTARKQYKELKNLDQEENNIDLQKLTRSKKNINNEIIHIHFYEQLHQCDQYVPHVFQLNPN